MASKKLNIPKFKNEDEERLFWDKFELSEHFNSNDFQNASFPELKPTRSAVSLQLPRYMLMRLKEKAHALNISYQSLVKRYIAEGLFAEVK